MIDASKIQKHAEVVGVYGKHVGTVDHMDGEDRIKLTRTDSDADGEHHYIPLAWVASVEDGKIKLSKSAAEVKADWTTV